MMQLFNWCEGFAGGRVIPEEVGVPAAARGAAAGAARGHRQGGGGHSVAQLDHHHHHPDHHHHHHPDKQVQKLVLCDALALHS